MLLLNRPITAISGPTAPHTILLSEKSIKYQTQTFAYYQNAVAMTVMMPMGLEKSICICRADLSSTYLPYSGCIGSFVSTQAYVL